MANSVNISIEAPIENQIQEITYDGQEIYQAWVKFQLKSNNSTFYFCLHLFHVIWTEVLIIYSVL